MAFVKISAFFILMFIALWLSFIFFFAGAFFYDDVIVTTACLITLLGIPVLLISFFSDKIKLTKKLQYWIMALILIAAPSVIKQTYFYYDRSFLRFNTADLKVLEYHPHKLITQKIYLDRTASDEFINGENELNVTRAVSPLYTAVSTAVYPERKNKYDNVVSARSTNKAYDHLIRRNVQIVSSASLSSEKFAQAKSKYIRVKFMSGVKSIPTDYVNNKVQQKGLDPSHTFLTGKTDWKQASLSKFMNESTIIDKNSYSAAKEKNSLNKMETINFPLRHFSQFITTNDQFELNTNAANQYILQSKGYDIIPSDGHSVSYQRSSAQKRSPFL